MTKTPLVHVVCIIALFELFTQCQCSTSANSQTDNKTRISSNIQSRMLPDDFESVETATHLISEPNDLVINDQIVNEGFQYFNDPHKISTPKYEAIPDVAYDTHQPINQFNLNHSYLPQSEATPQISNDDYAVQPQIIPNQHIVKVTREPIWAPELVKLENQYISTFRSIRSSVMSFYYRMQNFVSYVMSFFAVGKSFVVVQFIKMHFWMVCIHHKSLNVELVIQINNCNFCASLNCSPFSLRRTCAIFAWRVCHHNHKY